MKKLAYVLILVTALMMCLTVSAFAAEEPEAPFALAALEEDVLTEPAAPTAPEAEDVSVGEEAPPVQDGADAEAPGGTPVPEDRPNGWNNIDGVWYYYIDGFKAVSSWQMDGSDRCYVDEDGRMVTGWQEIDGATYYFNERHNGSYGAVMTGWQGIGGIWYYFEPTGQMVTSDWCYDGSSRCYVDENGHMLAGWQDIDGARYYLNERHDGTYGAVKTGWQSIGGDYYFFDNDGAMVSSAWVPDGASRCYVGGDGRMLTGWHTIDGKQYYFQEKHNGFYGGMATKHTYIGGEMYLFDSDGSLLTNTTAQLLGKIWPVNGDGVIEGYVTPAGRKAAAVLDQVGWNLRSAFNWSVRLTYRNRWLRAPAGNVHTEYYANYGFNNHYGNCYVMNSTLYQMMKMMGYEVYFVEGGVRNSNGYYAPHGWTEVILDGVLYVYDANFTNETGMNGFHIRYGQPGTWRYGQYSRVD